MVTKSREVFGNSFFPPLQFFLSSFISASSCDHLTSTRKENNHHPQWHPPSAAPHHPPACLHQWPAAPGRRTWGHFITSPDPWCQLLAVCPTIPHKGVETTFCSTASFLRKHHEELSISLWQAAGGRLTRAPEEHICSHSLSTAVLFLAQPPSAAWFRPQVPLKCYRFSTYTTFEKRYRCYTVSIVQNRSIYTFKATTMSYQVVLC